MPKTDLVRLFQTFLEGRVSSLDDYKKWRPQSAIITDGLDAHFGKGKSPFRVKEIIIVTENDGAPSAHILISRGRKYGSRKWIDRIRALLRCGNLYFYREEWEYVTGYAEGSYVSMALPSDRASTESATGTR
jgi:hypothetical protein